MALPASPDVGIRGRALLMRVRSSPRAKADDCMNRSRNSSSSETGCPADPQISRCLRRYFRLAMSELTRKEIPWE